MTIRQQRDSDARSSLLQRLFCCAPRLCGVQRSERRNELIANLGTVSNDSKNSAQAEIAQFPAPLEGLRVRRVVVMIMTAILRLTQEHVKCGGPRKHHTYSKPRSTSRLLYSKNQTTYSLCLKCWAALSRMVFQARYNLRLLRYTL